MLRAASRADIPRMVALGRRMHAKTRFAGIEYEPEAAARLGCQIIENGAAFLSDRGMIGGMNVPLVYGTTPAFSAVVFWYSEDGMAWKLLERFREWATLPVTVSTHDARMRRALERKGAIVVEEVMGWQAQH